MASISSTDDTARRTRKRFSTVQLMMLEQLFHRTSHPTREEREAVANTAGMYVISGTDVTCSISDRRPQGNKVCHHMVPKQTSDGAQSGPPQCDERLQ